LGVPFFFDWRAGVRTDDRHPFVPVVLAAMPLGAIMHELVKLQV
jgi:hypothetical protein